MGVVAGAAESELDHVGLAHHGRELPAQRRDHWALDLELRRQALGRAGIGRKAGDRKQILDRGRDALQRSRARTDGEGGIGGGGALAGMLRRPLRIGHELAAEAFVVGDRDFSERAGLELSFAKTGRDLD
jgi:hypothetical protein